MGQGSVQVALWGKDLYTHLDEVYRKRARFCVVFLSKHYRNKLWTNHERESAQARAFEEKEEYILPVKFDDTEIPGIKPTIAYISAIEYKPNELRICDQITFPFENLHLPDMWKWAILQV
jgi:hypothetical protein